MTENDLLTPLAFLGLALFATALLLIVGISIGRLIRAERGARQSCAGLLGRAVAEILSLIAKQR